MFVDSRTLPEDYVVETDVCIIGGGAAGITMAREYLESSFKVCLLESGGLEPNGDTQGLYAGENVGQPYFPLDVARLRYFGGTTNHWGGVCRPFSESDFKTHDWIPYSGWPIGLIDLLPYYERASDVLALNADGWDLDYWKQYDDSLPFPFSDDRVETRLAMQSLSPVKRLGKTYRDEIKNSSSITTYFNSNVTGIETDVTGKTVKHLNVECLSGNKFLVKARFYVLAVGGIENARLLLLSNKVNPLGVGNQNDLVGRFFMEHPRFFAGIFYPSTPNISAGLYKWHNVNNSRLNGYLGLSEDVIKKEKLVDVQVRLDFVLEKRYVEASNSNGVSSLRHLLDSSSSKDDTYSFGEHIGNIVSDIDDVFISAYRKVRYDDFPFKHIELYPRVDQAPNPDSRVTLSDDLDQLGQRRAKLDWKLSSIDMHSVKRTLEIMGVEMGKAGLGRLKLDINDDGAWPIDTEGGWHHMGTTRMSDDASDGVVDKNCKVHGVSNLYVAGSSVFPTGGSGTPTLTLMALAIRLADFIAEEAA